MLFYRALYDRLCRDPRPPFVSQLDESKSIAVAQSFETSPHAPLNPLTRLAYQRFCNETREQFALLRDAGLSIEPWDHEGQPYSGSADMAADVHGGHIHFFLTKRGHGNADDDLDQRTNPLLQPAKVTLDGHKLVVNDLFRVVHDVLGHAIHGFQFGPLGEENAWRSHRATFSPLAAWAMTTETRGQNSWFNFGPHVLNAAGKPIRRGDPGFVPANTRPYALQKMCLLPAWCAIP